MFSLDKAAVDLEPSDVFFGIQIYNSTFDNIYGSRNKAIYAVQIVKLYMENANFTSTPIKNNMTMQE